MGKFESLADVLSDKADRAPDANAFTFWASGTAVDSLSYRQLEQAARASAKQLADCGAYGRHVLLLHPPGLDFLVDLFGCFYAGAIAVPVPPPQHSRDRRRFEAVVDIARPQLALAGPMATTEGLAKWREDWSQLPFLSESRRTEAAAAFRAVAADACAVVQFTSGSSAAPKGIQLSHRAILHNLEQIRLAFDFRAAERPEAVALWLPHFHDMGLFGRLECIHAGCPCHLMSPTEFMRRPKRWMELVSSCRATVTGGPNFAFDLAADAASSANLDLSRVRVAFCGAEPIKDASLRRFAAVFASAKLDESALTPCYGLAEATLMVASHVPGTARTVISVDRSAFGAGLVKLAAAGASQQLVSSGRVCPGTELLLVDPEFRRPMPAGEVGEIWIRGINVAKAHFGDHRDDPGNEMFGVPAGAAPNEPHYVRTGDLGFIQADQLFIIGRLKNLIIINGRNIFPHDIERLIPGADPRLAAARAAVIGVDTDAGERLAVIVEAPRNLQRAAVELAVLAKRVRDVVREACDVDPVRVILAARGAIDYTTSGKIAYHSTAKRFRTGNFRVLAEWPSADERSAFTPAGVVETRVMAVVEAVLGRSLDNPDLGIQELGGDSMAATRIAGRIAALYGDAFDARDCVRGPSVRAIARKTDDELIRFVDGLSDSEAEAALAVVLGLEAPANAGGLR